jgi:CheY-like chemotaxis protein
VAITANALAGDRETYLASGMDDYVSKPIKVEELMRVLQSCEPIYNQWERGIRPFPSHLTPVTD